MLQWAAEQARRNAERRAAAGPAPLAVATDLGARIERVARMSDAERAEIDRRAARAAEVEAQWGRATRVTDCERASGVPPRYARATFDGFGLVPADAREAYAAAAADLRATVRRGGIVVLAGPRGAGKTYLACAAVNAFCRSGRPARYMEATDYFDQIDGAINARESVESVEDRAVRPHLLVLDAMEERAETPHKDRRLTRLIGKRDAAQLPTVLITNESQERFMERVGESVADRIRHGGLFIECHWPSLRGRIDVQPRGLMN